MVSGKGVRGAVTEYRHGIQAHIGLELDYSASIRKCWAFPTRLSEPSHELHVLLSMSDRSAVLYLSDDMREVMETDIAAAPYDLSSRTIEAKQISDNMVVQITENYLVVNRLPRYVVPSMAPNETSLSWLPSAKMRES